MFDVFGNFDSVEELNACAKGLLEEQDLEHLKVLAEGYYLPTPPEVDNNYMASLKREDRVNRMRRQGVKFAKKKTEYDLEQLSLF